MEKKKVESIKDSKSRSLDQQEESEESILEIVKDDIIRIAGGEKSKKVPLEVIKSKIKASSSIISKAIKDLEKRDLIQLEDSLLRLTKQGRVNAESIIKKHAILEDYFKEKRGSKEAHKAADIIEHYISVEVLNNIKELSTLKGEGRPLTELELNQDNLITDIDFSAGGLFERVVSMGILPGERIKAMYKIPDGFIVSVSRKKIALGEDIAKKIRVLE